jgi:hypothetical protein
MHVRKAFVRTAQIIYDKFKKGIITLSSTKDSANSTPQDSSKKVSITSQKVCANAVYLVMRGQN